MACGLVDADPQAALLNSSNAPGPAGDRRGGLRRSPPTHLQLHGDCRTFSQLVAHSVTIPPLGACGCSGARRSGGELILGPIWPWLVRFTPNREAENEAEVASFGPPLTRTHWVRVASRGLIWGSVVALSGVARSGKTFNSRPFPLISYHSSHRRMAMRPGMRGSRLRGNDGYIRGNDACNQCTGRCGDGAMGICRGSWALQGREPVWACVGVAAGSLRCSERVQ